MRNHKDEEKTDLACNFCSKNEFKNRRSLTKHIKRVHVEPKFKCTICEKAFKRDKNLIVILIIRLRCGVTPLV